MLYPLVLLFFFQAEDGIRDLVRSRGLGDVYKRQPKDWQIHSTTKQDRKELGDRLKDTSDELKLVIVRLSLIHI